MDVVRGAGPSEEWSPQSAASRESMDVVRGAGPSAEEAHCARAIAMLREVFPDWELFPSEIYLGPYFWTDLSEARLRADVESYLTSTRDEDPDVPEVAQGGELEDEGDTIMLGQEPRRDGTWWEYLEQQWGSEVRPPPPSPITPAPLPPSRDPPDLRGERPPGALWWNPLEQEWEFSPRPATPAHWHDIGVTTGRGNHEENGLVADIFPLQPFPFENLGPPATGRGSLLTCGDIEENPGPRRVPSALPYARPRPSPPPGESPTALPPPPLAQDTPGFPPPMLPPQLRGFPPLQDPLSALGLLGPQVELTLSQDLQATMLGLLLGCGQECEGMTLDPPAEAPSNEPLPPLPLGLDLPGFWPLPNLAPLKSCASHIECVHLPSLPDTSPLLPWLQRMNRRVCARCLLLAPISGRCRRCDALPLVDLGVLPQGPPAQPDPSSPLTEDWLRMLDNPAPVLRRVPDGSSDLFFAALASELEFISVDSAAADLWRVAAFCRIVLAPLGRGGKRHCRQAAAQVNLRIGRWQAGQFASLISDYAQIQGRFSGRTAPRPDTLVDDLLPDNVRRAALRAVSDGALSKAARLLGEVVHPLPDDTAARLLLLHPRAPPPTLDALPQGACGEDFTAEEVAHCLRRFPPGSSGGYSGLMPAHLNTNRSSANHLRVLQQVARIASDFAWGRLNPDASAALAAARLIPIGKKGGGVRPIAVGELIRRIAGKLLVSRYQAEAAVPLAPLQVGVGFAGGAEAIIHKTRGWLDTAPPDHCLLQCDFTNAYNSLSRQRMLEAVASECQSSCRTPEPATGSMATSSGPVSASPPNRVSIRGIHWALSSMP